MPNCFADTTGIDDELSNRWIDLDPAGYFLIKIDTKKNAIEAAHFKNTIDKDGKACDPKTGEVIPCDGSYKPTANQLFTGRTAKELSVLILETHTGNQSENNNPPLITMLVHANYLGREFQRAEQCLVDGTEYVQD
jgi:dihydropteroate synthase